VPNLVVPVVVNGTVKFFNNPPGTVHLVADLAGILRPMTEPARRRPPRASMAAEYRRTSAAAP
jgi:hypothetical protein